MRFVCIAATSALAAATPLAGQDFSTSVLLCRSDATSSVALGDLDGDGDLDLVYGNGRHYANRSIIHLNGGAGAFDGELPLFPLARKTYAVALGDLDGDGDLDAVAGTDFGDYDQVFLNAGNGTFVAGPLLDDGDGLGGRGRAVRDVALEDLDGDGAPDVVLAVRGGPDLVFWNDGTGQRWSAEALDERATESIAIATADIDGDGDADIAAARRGLNALWVNEGGRTFRARALPGGDQPSISVAVADLDGRDGPDVIVGNEGAPNAIHWNDGRGAFARSSTFGTGDDNTRAIVAADVDGDADHDLVVGNLQRGFEMLGPRSWALPVLDQPNRIYLNTGAGAFETGPTFGQAGSQTRDVAVGDLDGDGRPDIVEANDCGTDAVHLRR